MDFDLDAYSFDLPEGRIAQHPAKPRDSSKLMVLDRDGPAQHTIFRTIPDLLPSPCLLVLNDTRVRAARIHATKETGGEVELMLVPDPKLEGTSTARFLTRGRMRRAGLHVHLGDETLVFLRRDEDSTAILETSDGSPIQEVLDRYAKIPLPPYIERPQGPTEADKERYQTVYAQNSGAVAAPTAGLHFTDEIFASFRQRDIDVAHITLHVGPGTFLPVRHQDIREHSVMAEPTLVPEQTAQKVQDALERKIPIIAVGTTVVRTLEGAALRAERLGTDRPLAFGAHQEDMVILPGHRFRIIDGMLTNFHLPKSSLLLLVSALVGRERLLSAYQEAIQNGYRFYSYGDAMYIVPRRQR